MPQTIDATLKQISRTTEEKQATELARRLGIGYMFLQNYPFVLDVLSLVPLEEVREKQLAAYIRSTSKVRVAAVHPESEATKAEIRRLARTWNLAVETVVISPYSLQCLLSAYVKLLQQKTDAAQAAQRPPEKNHFDTVTSLDTLRQEAATASVTDLVDLLLAAAYNLNASDIHIEPGEQNLLVRLRVDGVLEPVLTLPMAAHHGLISRIKILAGIKIDNAMNAQDGRFSVNHPNVQLDLRVSTIPTHYGEGTVMRLLRSDSQLLTLKELGFSEYNLDLITKAIRKPYGLILATGPTGSGKSTTLYSFLNELNHPEKKIITLEDPVEYRLEGIQQSQIDADKGFTFAEGLRGALRQDPDIIMVGEIRDAETATIALNASLTGHLVLSTLHTNNAVSAPVRCLEMGIPQFLLTGSIQMIIGQRLVRRLVPGSSPEQPQYKGRAVISEVLVPTQEFDKAITEHFDLATLQETARKGGMRTMLEDGLEKVKAGITSEAEVYRVA